MAYTPFTDTGDPYEQFKQNRLFTYGRGEQLQGDLNGRVGGSQSLEEAYRNQAHGAFEPLLNGYSGPGYSPEEQRNIARQDEMSGLPITQDRINDLYATEDDTRNVMGNPYEARMFARPEYMDALNTSGQEQTRAAYQDQASGMRGAIDPNRLRLADSYGQDQNAILNGSDAGVRGAIDPNQLRQDSGLADRYRMTDRDVQDYQDRASRNVHNSKQAALDEIEQRAVSSGNVSPLAMGALRNRYEQGAQVNAADAALDARLGAKNAQAQREMNLEQNRQDAEQGYAGLRSNAEMRIGDRRSGVLSDTERMRLGAEQGLTDRNLDTERTIGNNRIAAEQGIQDRNLDSAKFNQQFGAQLFQDTDKTASDRNRGLLENRQNVGMFGETQRFNQGFQTNNALAQRYGAVADARRQDQSEGRGWLQHNVDQSSNNVNTGNQQRLGLYGQQTGALDQNAGTMAQYDLGRRGQGFGANFKSGFGKALGSFAGGGFLTGSGGN